MRSDGTAGGAMAMRSARARVAARTRLEVPAIRLEVRLGCEAAERATPQAVDLALVIDFAAAEAAARGRVIGVVTAVKTFGALVGALATPWLYGVSPRYCFGATSLVLLVGAVVLALALFWEHRHRPLEASVPAAEPEAQPERVPVP